ncbi:hypothetical protein I553_3924 [Mycobacterium xenopi 4042]|uniref:Uncharacterized protein n=1 Tax=Mycobacterium xenopi 4042 TaxID=1299334 RepID=X8DDF4_MYCXE|nr:hypothetical protein I553_3924 [Mycobacterium xenopi 4042]
MHPFHGARLIEVEQPKDQPRGSGVVSSPTKSQWPRSMNASIASSVISRADSRNRSAEAGERLSVASRSSNVSVGRFDRQDGNGIGLGGTPWTARS